MKKKAQKKKKIICKREQQPLYGYKTSCFGSLEIVSSTCSDYLFNTKTTCFVQEKMIS